MCREQARFGAETEHECGIIGVAREEAIRAADEVAIHLSAYLKNEAEARKYPLDAERRFKYKTQARAAREAAYRALARWKQAWG